MFQLNSLLGGGGGFPMGHPMLGQAPMGQAQPGQAQPTMGQPTMGQPMPGQNPYSFPQSTLAHNNGFGLGMGQGAPSMMPIGTPAPHLPFQFGGMPQIPGMPAMGGGFFPLRSLGNFSGNSLY